MADSDVRFWLRGEIFLKGLLPLAPPPTLCYENLRKLVAFAKVRRAASFPSLDFDAWKEASGRLQIPLDLAQTYYSVFAGLEGGEEERAHALEGSGRFPKGRLARSNSSVAEETLTPSVDVRWLSVFLWVQRLSRAEELGASLGRDELPRLLRRAHSTSSLDCSASRPVLQSTANGSIRSPSQTSNENAHRILEFFGENCRRLLFLLATADLKITDYHEALPAEPAHISLDSLGALDLLLEGAPAADTRDPETCRPQPISQLLRNPELLKRVRNLDGGISPGRLSRLILEGLEADPFYLLQLTPGPVHSRRLSQRLSLSKETPRQAYLGASVGPLGRRVVFAHSLHRRAVVKYSGAMDGHFLSVGPARQAQLYFPASFAAASVSDLAHSTLLLGPVTAVLRLHNLRHCKVYAVAGRVVVSECSDVELHIRCPTRPLILGPANERLTIGPHNTAWPELRQQATDAGLGPETADRSLKPVILTKGEKRATRLSEAGAIVRLQDPKDFFPFAPPFVTSGASGGVEVAFEPPEVYESAWRERLSRHQAHLNDLRGLDDRDRAHVQEALMSSFHAWLGETGSERELEQLRALEAKAKQPHRPARRRPKPAH